MPRLLTITFTTAVFWAEAAYGSLKPPPTRRLRRALLHLSYSTTISRLLDTTRSSNRTGGFPASGSRKRHTLLRRTLMNRGLFQKVEPVHSFCGRVTHRLSNGWANGCSAQVIVSVGAKWHGAQSAHRI